MAQDSTEVLLARSQLDKLYELGILSRTSEDGEEHSQSSKSSSSGGFQRHDAFLAALPPPSAVYPLPPRLFQPSVDELDPSQLSGTSSNSRFYGGRSGGISSHLLELARHRQHYNPRQRRTSLQASASVASSINSMLKSESAQRGRRLLRMWFRQWKIFIRLRRDKARRRAAVLAFVKQTFFTKWAHFLRQRRYEDDKRRLFDTWKVARATSRWVEWKQRCHLLRRLLNGGRSSFMGRLIQQRIWRRWIQFAKQREYVRTVLDQRASTIHHLLKQNAWHGLRIHVFRARQNCLLMRRCLKGMSDFRAIQERQRVVCMKHQLKMHIGRKRELLHRWRTFAYMRGRDRRLAWRVQFGVSRRKYFLLWCEVGRTVHHVTQLRSKVSYRVMREHFLAWNRTVKAIQFGDKVRGNRERRLRKIYFGAYKDQARFRSHCHRVNLTLTHRRLAVVVNFLHIWASERRQRKERGSQVQQVWQIYLLRRVWVTGWLRVHYKRLAHNHYRAAIEERYFGIWKRFLRIQQAYHLQEERAEVLHGTLCCKRSFAEWKIYYKLRLKHAQELTRAQEHYHRHLLQWGVVTLWGAVYQNAQNSLRSHHLRQNMRISLKKQHFRAWYALTLSRKLLLERLYGFQQSRGYQNSVCNPNRRTWNRWMMFVSVCWQRHRCDQHFELRVKRKVLLVWHRQAKMESRLRGFDFHRHRRVVRAFFGQWVARVEEWRKLGVICELAEKVYERKLCTRVIRDWRSLSTYFRRVRLCGEFVQRQRESKLVTTYFLEWRDTFDGRQRASRLKCSREHQQLRLCFTSWLKHSVQQKAFTRKLAYFQQAYGKYPTLPIVSRTWHRWAHICKLTRGVKLMRTKQHLKQVRQCWLHWKFFHVSCCVFRTWHQAAQTKSVANSKLGRRLRCFRKSRHGRLQRFSMDKWKSLVKQRRILQEKQSLWKHNLNRELEEARGKSEQAARFCLRNWFRRWCIAYNKSSDLARDHFRISLLQKVVLAWRKAMIHAKQEKVLVEAQKAIDKLSYYHPQQQVYIARAKRSDSRKKEKKLSMRNVKVVPVDSERARADLMQKMRRMLDPTEYATYSRFYQESSKVVASNEQSRGITKKSVPQIANASRSKPTNPEPHQQDYSDQSSREGQLHLAGSKLRDGVGAEGGHRIAACDHISDICSSCGAMSVNASSGVDLRQNHPVPPATSNQVGLKPQNFRAGAKTPEYLRRDRSVLLEVSDSDTPRSNHGNGSPNELPLFDDDLARTGVGKPKIIAHPTKHVTFVEPPVRFADAGEFEQPPRIQQSVFIPSASKAESVHKDRPRHPDTGYKVREASKATVFDPSLSLDPGSASKTSGNRHHKHQVAKIRKVAHNKQIKVISSRNNEARPLADILQLNGGVDADFSGGCDVRTNTHCNDDPSCDATVIKEIVSFYDEPDNGVRAYYRMTRDLSLLQNDFYIDELQKVYDANFKDKVIVDSGKQEKQMRLERFLEQLVESHPTYRNYVHYRRRQSYNQSSVPLSALRWLAQQHLPSQLSSQKRAKAGPKKSKPYWIWEPMPTDMDAALEKLLPAITKYMRVLGQFFLRQAVQSTSAADKPKDYRMGSAAFISLMKQVRVFPQLFHRRELENAVRQSSCSSPDSEEMNFPEFIEALVRCSCSLRWGELEGGNGETHSNDTVVVIKFVMLIFAMEGQGSVLKKRSEDVSAILGFLGQQQKRQQAKKLFRFREMLADNKRRTRKDYQTASVWNHVRLQFSPKRPPPHLSPTRSHDTFDELTESWDGGSSCRVSTDPFVFEAQTNQPFGLGPPQSPNGNATESQAAQRSEQGLVEILQDKHGDEDILSGKTDESHFSPVFLSESLSSPLAENAAATSSKGDHKTESPKQESLASKECNTAQKQHDHEEYPSSASSRDTTSHSQNPQLMPKSTALAEPMEKDEFLREILNSIGDVELMLSQQRFRGSNYPRNGRKRQQGVNSSLCETRAEPTVNIPSLSGLAADCLSHEYSHVWHGDGDIFSDIERFTESTDNTSLVAIAAMAELPFTQDREHQEHVLEQNLWATEEIRPTEEVAVNTSPQASSTRESETHEMR